MKTKLPKRLRTYLLHESVRCKPSTIAGYQVNLSHFRDWLESVHPALSFKKQIARLTKLKLQDYFAYLNGKNLVPYSKVNYLLSVKKYLQWEVDQGTLDENLLAVLDRKNLPKVPEYLPRPLSSENDRLLQQRLRQSDSHYAPLFLLLRHTGLRISELINLPTDCVITTSRGERYLKVPLGKMNNERLVPLSQESLELIEKIRTSAPLKPKRWSSERLIGIDGSVQSLYSILALRFEKIVGDLTDQGKPITFHRLRHTYATSLLSGGVGLVSLMKLLGHRRIEMTLRYAKVTPSHLRDEYLKAMKIIENQSVVINEIIADVGDYGHPATLIAQLASFLVKTSVFKGTQQRNILRRLRRLEQDLRPLSFSHKFKSFAERDKCVVRWAG